VTRFAQPVVVAAPLCLADEERLGGAEGRLEHDLQLARLLADSERPREILMARSTLWGDAYLPGSHGFGALTSLARPSGHV
jgi:hypothetical protein